MRRSVTIPLLVALTACRTDSGEPQERRLDCAERFQRATAATTKEVPIRLVGCVLSEEVASAEAAQIMVAVVNVSNAPLQAWVRLDLLDALHLTIVAPNGDTLELPFAWEPFDVDPELVTFALPRGGFVGRMINLNCDLSDFEFAELGAPCTPLYAFDQQGEYTMTIEYSDAWACASKACKPEEAWSGTLRTDPLIVRVRAR